MPQEHDRHSKSSSEWGTEPSRSQQRAAAASDDPTRASLPSKQKKGVCKGADGWHLDHDLVFTREQAIGGGDKPPCHWAALGNWVASERRYIYTPGWSCTHEERCARCGHLERHGFQIRNDGDCPDRDSADPTVPGGVLRDCEAKQRDVDERSAKWAERIRFRKPPVTGPQGYRKPRVSKKKDDG
jgi:hypothetical protein